MSVSIRLPDNSVKTFDHNPTVLEVAQSIGSRLANDCIAGKLNDEIIDLRTTLKDNDQIFIITTQSPEANEVIRHSAAHVMAQAVQEIWPKIQVTIGPVIENGFYYDFYSPHHNFTPDDLVKIEKKMEEIVSRKLPILREDWSSAQAIEFFQKSGEDFKAEIIKDLGSPSVSVYKQGEWLDLCRGPHVQNTSQIKALKVLSLAGAYWRGDENRELLQRVYATAFNDKKALTEYLTQIEEAKKRDHRKLGKELGLFHFSPIAPGSPFFTALGSIVYNELQNYMRDLYVKYGYGEVITPQIFDVELFKQSGHMKNYQDNMYFTEVEKRQFSSKPMNCPGHCVLFGMEHHSYKELPIRMADFGRLHRFERSGVMHGLTRVRSFCQDDAHIFCSLEQVPAEIVKFVAMLDEVYEKLELKYTVFLSTRPELREGSDESWDKAEAALAKAMDELKIPFKYQPGEGAFYGPKIEFNVTDAIGRNWQLGTIQADFVLPEKFDLKFAGEDNREHRPVMLHRAVLGSLERFIGVYLEHTAGKLPTWVSPVQVQILNVTDNQAPFCKELHAICKENGIRVHFDDRSEKLGYKIREATLKKIPYMLIIGDKELETRTVSVRMRDGTVKNDLNINAFVESIKQEVKERLSTSLLGNL